MLLISYTLSYPLTSFFQTLFFLSSIFSSHLFCSLPVSYFTYSHTCIIFSITWGKITSGFFSHIFYHLTYSFFSRFQWSRLTFSCFTHSLLPHIISSHFFLFLVLYTPFIFFTPSLFLSNLHSSCLISFIPSHHFTFCLISSALYAFIYSTCIC